MVDTPRQPISSYFTDDDTDPDPRADKPWPPDQDCPGCDKHVDGPHRFTCRAVTPGRTKLNVSGSQIGKQDT